MLVEEGPKAGQPREDGLRLEERLFRDEAEAMGFKVTRPEWDGSLYHSKRMDFRLYDPLSGPVCEIEIKDRKPSSYQKSREIANDFVKENPRNIPQIIFGSFSPTKDSLSLLKGIGLVRIPVKFEDDTSLWKREIEALLAVIKGALHWGIGLVKAVKLSESPVGSAVLAIVGRVRRVCPPRLKWVTNQLNGKASFFLEKSHRLKAVSLARFIDNKLGLRTNSIHRLGSPSKWPTRIGVWNRKARLD